MTRRSNRICCSALEVARMTGWDNEVGGIETLVKTAIAALEKAGYIKRGNNVSHVYAIGILAKNMDEASTRIYNSVLLLDGYKQNAKRIIKSLISSRSIARASNDDAESRVDYLADILGIPKAEVITIVNLMRKDGLLADTQDMSAYILKDNTENCTSMILDRFAKLEQFILNKIDDGICELNLKELNEEAENAGIARTNVKNIRMILYFLNIKHFIKKTEHVSNFYVQLVPQVCHKDMIYKFEQRMNICRFVVRQFYMQADKFATSFVRENEKLITFSLVRLYKDYCASSIFHDISLQDVEDTLLYLSTIGAIRLEGGFLVLYNGMEINRLIMDNKIQYKKEDYKKLNKFYAQKIQQIHIVGEFANTMVRDYNAALQFINDYFQMNFRKFISKYFKGNRAKEIGRNITPQKYQQLFGQLSPAQAKIINDNNSQYIAEPVLEAENTRPCPQIGCLALVGGCKARTTSDADFFSRCCHRI